MKVNSEMCVYICTYIPTCVCIFPSNRIMAAASKKIMILRINIQDQWSVQQERDKGGMGQVPLSPLGTVTQTPSRWAETASGSGSVWGMQDPCQHQVSVLGNQCFWCNRRCRPSALGQASATQLLPTHHQYYYVIILLFIFHRKQLSVNMGKNRNAVRGRRKSHIYISYM